MTDAAPPQQADGCFPRVNGEMIQSRAYNQMIVSLVGKVIANSQILSADGTIVNVITDQIPDGALIVNPDMVIELMGQVVDETTIMVRTLTIKLRMSNAPVFLNFVPHRS